MNRFWKEYYSTSFNSLEDKLGLLKLFFMKNNTELEDLGYQFGGEMKQITLSL